jgi:hypothetical protein
MNSRALPARRLMPGIICFERLSAPEARRTVAPGERSEPGVGNGVEGALKGRWNRMAGETSAGFRRPYQGSFCINSFRGLAKSARSRLVSPSFSEGWLLSGAPPGLKSFFSASTTLFAASMRHCTRRRRSLLATVFLVLLSFGLPAARGADRDGRWAILIAGASGDPDLQKEYLDELKSLRAALVGPLGFPGNQVAVLFEDPSKDPGMIQQKSTLQGLQEVCRDFAVRVKKEDLVFVFIEGHGNYDGDVYKLNLVGPDPTASDLAAMLYSIPAQRFVVVNATSCSGGSLAAFSQKGKVVITSTKSGMEKNQSHFGRFVVEAFRENAADADKNGRVSVLEAFTYAARKVEEYYQKKSDLQTEHPVLDDNGDGQGQGKPSPENGEGLLAQTTFPGGGIAAAGPANLTSEQQKLAEAAMDLEAQIDALKYAKSGMPESEYEKKLEDLLLRLAEVNARLPK